MLNFIPRFLEKSLWSLVDKSKIERLAVKISCTACEQAGNDDTKWKVQERQPTSYGCGGYISKGRSICQMNPILQEELGKKVIDAILNFYRPYLEKDGRQKLAQAVKEQTGFEKQDNYGGQW